MRIVNYFGKEYVKSESYYFGKKYKKDGDCG